MRGKGRFQLSGTGTRRITPAYAGKRLRNGIHLSMSWDHPRLCGEKFPGRALTVSTMGSPPPMRGKVSRYAEKYHFYRITPAYAGKRQKGKVFVFCLQDHPRLCGEKFVWRHVSYEKVGSPPPMRGKVQQICWRC